ncbi:hypothetical protein [Nostoc sp.]|uniref:hypothetical protein n=1 Tax=Nostoc sp. TaxID=1180 RepID=UPI002FF5B4BE
MGYGEDEGDKENNLCPNTVQLSISSFSLRPWWYPAGSPLAFSKSSRSASTLKKLTLTKSFSLNPGVLYYEQQYHDRIVKNLQKKAGALSLELVPISQDAQNTPSSPTLAT